MFKQISLLRRRPDISVAAFEEYYEKHHAPILAEVMPDARRYLRRYVRPERNPFESQDLAVPFDCMTEFWSDSREAFVANASALQDPAAYNRLYEDEEKLFASHDNPLFSVHEVESELERSHEARALIGPNPSGAPDEVLKIVFLLRRKPELSPAEFIDYYETRHRVLAEKALGKALRYVRRYVQTEINPVVGEPIEIPFDVMTEIWWANRTDWDTARLQMSANGLGRALYEDEEALFASHDNPMFCVKEADSPMRGWS